MHAKKRLILAAGILAGVGAVMALAVGVTFGLFSATPSQATQSTFASGTVSLGEPLTDTPCTTSTNMVPGDSAENACEFKVTYDGSAPAWIGIKLHESGTGLYTGASAGLQYTITEGSTEYTTEGHLNADGTILYVAADPGGENAGTYDFKVSYELPSGSTLQDKTSSLDMTVYAVQSAHNGSEGSQTAGQPSVGITWN